MNRISITEKLISGVIVAALWAMPWLAAIAVFPIVGPAA